MGAEQQGKPGPWPGRAGESKPCHAAESSQAHIASHPLPPAQAGATLLALLPCQGILPPRVPLLLLAHPSTEHAKADRHWTVARRSFFLNLIHPSFAQQPGLHICGLSINRSITTHPHPNQPQGMRDLQKRAPYADAPGFFSKGTVYHTNKRTKIQAK